MISEDSTQSTYGIFSEQTKESTPGKTTGKITEFTSVIITEKITGKLIVHTQKQNTSLLVHWGLMFL
jgi:hypothetical protein